MTQMTPDQARALQGLRGTRGLEYLAQQYADTKDSLVDAKEHWLVLRLQGRAALLRELISIIQDEG